MRLDKLLYETGYGSKKQVERLLLRRLVTVAGEVVTLPSYNVDTAVQQLTVAGVELRHSGHHYYLLNKPSGVVTAANDKQHKTVLDLLQPIDYSPTLFPVGRLDRDTEGLLLLTDNGQLGYQLLSAKRAVVKEYRVRVNQPLTLADCQAFANGIVFIGGEKCRPARLIIEAGEVENIWARVQIIEGKYHQVKKMFLAVGKKVMYLQRIKMGPLELDSTLKVGEYRPLTTSEKQQLIPFFNP